MKAKAFEYIVEKELGNSSCVNGFGARSKNYPLCKAVVDYNHDRIETQGWRKVGDEVDGGCLKGRVVVDGMGQRGEVVGWVLTLFC